MKSLPIGFNWDLAGGTLASGIPGPRGGPAGATRKDDECYLRTLALVVTDSLDSHAFDAAFGGFEHLHMDLFLPSN